MPSYKVSDDELIAAFNKFGGDVEQMAAALSMDRWGIRQRLKRMTEDGRLQPDRTGQVPPPSAELKVAREKLKQLETQLLTDEFVARTILNMARTPANPPSWTLEAKKGKTDLTGVPTLFLSDWHWGEVVRPEEIGGVNEYNMTIAQSRARTVISVAVDLLTNHLSSARYPGICLLLGGDMVSGDIHDELRETNETATMPTWIDLLGTMKWVINELHQTFGKVFVVGVTGNHGRTTHKPRAKRRNHSNFDWLLYKVLERDYTDNRAVSFMIPEGPDALFRLYGHRYLLTHGDQFRGGDGIIGPLGPITRGDIKKRSRQAQLNQGYDTLLMGHWHQLIQLDSLIVNGSLKGYDEYAAASNFKFENPRQALWITHPDLGITIQMPVYAERRHRSETVEWVSVAS